MGDDIDRTVKQPESTGTVTADELARLKNDVEALSKEVSSVDGHVWSRRSEAHDTRFCHWEGQSADGRKHEKQLNVMPFPFEGASDARVRLADTIVGENVAIQLSAAQTALERIAPMEATDMAFATRVRTLVKWALLTSQGSRFWRELEKCLQYKEADSPAVGVMGVYWKQQEELDYETIDLEQAAMMILQSMGMLDEEGNPAEGDFERMLEILVNEEQADEVRELLRGVLPESVSDKTVKRIARELRKDGTAEFPLPYLKTNAPCWVAHRLMQDIFFSSATDHLQDAPRIVRRELVDASDVDARAKAEGWSTTFAIKLKEQKGKTAFPEIVKQGSAEFTDITMEMGTADNEKCEVLYAYERLTNEDGISGIFLTTFSPEIIGEAAKKRELLGYLHGDYPFVEMPREILNDRLWDSRGVPEIVMTEQTQLKTLDDSFADHTSISTIPPVSVPRNRPRMQLVIGPLKQVKEDRPGQIRFWDVPKYPTSADKYTSRVYWRVNEYFGRPGEGVDPDMVILKRQKMVNGFMTSMCAAVRMTVQLCFQYLPDEEIQRIVGRPQDKEPFQVPRSRREIQGLYDLAMSFNVKTLNNEYVIGVIKAIGEMILPMDTESTVLRDKLVGLSLSMLDPYIADLVLQPVEQADRQEVEDELLNFTQIAAGIEPEMQEQGQNHGLRMQVLQGIGQRNPEAFTGLNDTSKQILKKRMEHLGFMVEQQQNAQIGRVGARGALA